MSRPILTLIENRRFPWPTNDWEHAIAMTFKRDYASSYWTCMLHNSTPGTPKMTHREMFDYLANGQEDTPALEQVTRSRTP